MVYSILFILTFLFGIFVSKVFTKYTESRENEKKRLSINDFYKSIVDNIYSDKTLFVNRINQTVCISTTISDVDYNIIYIMDKKDVAVFQEESCVFSSELVTTELLDELILAIEVWYKDKINDVVNVFGFTFSKEEFESKFNMKVEDIKKNMYGQEPVEKSDIDTIIEDNEVKHNIDDILDKISERGIASLNASETNFLKEYSERN